MIAFGATLEKFFGELYRPRRIPDGSQETFRKYKILFTHFERFLGRVPLLQDLDSDTVADFLAWFAEGGRAPATINKTRGQLLALARYATQKRLLYEVPDVRPWRTPLRLPRAYTIDQLGVLLGACRQSHGFICGLPAGRFWEAVCLVLYDTGIRPGACWAIRRPDVDLAEHTVFVSYATQKQRADQLLRISTDTVEAIRGIWTPERSLLFPWDRNPGTRYIHWRRILQRAGLPWGRMNMFSKLRKTCATLCKANGGDATQQLGHSSDAVTRKYYLAPGAGVQAADILPRPHVSIDRQLRLF